MMLYLITELFIATLWHRAGHYILAMWLLSFFFMAALCNRGHCISAMWFLLSFFLSFYFSSPNLSRRRLDACHTSTHGVTLVRI